MKQQNWTSQTKNLISRISPQIVGLILFGLLLMACSESSTEAELIQIKGTLVDEISGQPIRGADLQLMLIKYTDVGAQFSFAPGHNPMTETDNSGLFHFKDVLLPQNIDPSYTHYLLLGNVEDNPLELKTEIGEPIIIEVEGHGIIDLGVIATRLK